MRTVPLLFYIPQVSSPLSTIFGSFSFHIFCLCKNFRKYWESRSLLNQLCSISVCNASVDHAWSLGILCIVKWLLVSHFFIDQLLIILLLSHALCHNPLHQPKMFHSWQLSPFETMRHCLNLDRIFSFFVHKEGSRIFFFYSPEKHFHSGRSKECYNYIHAIDYDCVAYLQKAEKLITAHKCVSLNLTRYILLIEAACCLLSLN